MLLSGFITAVCGEAGANVCAYVTQASEHQIVVIDVGTQEVVGSITCGADCSPTAISASQDGRVYLADVSGSVLAVDLAENRVVATIRGRTPGGERIHTSPDGSSVYVAHYRGVGLVDVRAGLEVAWFDTRATGISTTADSQFAYISTDDGILAVRAADRAIVGRIDGRFADIVLGMTGNDAYVSRADDDSVHRIDVRTGAVQATIPILPCTSVDGIAHCAPGALGLDPNSARLYVVSHIERKVSVVDTTTDQVIDEIILGRPPTSPFDQADPFLTGIAVTPDGAYVYVSGAGDREGVLWAIPTSESGIFRRFSFPYLLRVAAAEVPHACAGGPITPSKTPTNTSTPSSTRTASVTPTASATSTSSPTAATVADNDDGCAISSGQGSGSGSYWGTLVVLLWLRRRAFKGTPWY